MITTNMRVILAVLLFGLATACSGTEVNIEGVDLPFETIEQAEKPLMTQGYLDREPGIIVIANKQDVDHLHDWVNEDTKEYLRGLDYEHSFVLAVFQGWKSTGGYEIEILQITHQGGKVYITANLVDAPPEGPVTLAVTSPYHVITMPKDKAWDETIEFKLVSNGEVITSVSKYIP